MRWAQFSLFFNSGWDGAQWQARRAVGRIVHHPVTRDEDVQRNPSHACMGGKYAHAAMIGPYQSDLRRANSWVGRQ